MRITLFIISILFTMQANAQDKKQTNKHFWNTLETTADPSDIWSIWTNVNQWKTWDSGLKDAMMNEAFQLNAKGEIISLEGRKSKFKIVEIEEGVSYTFKTNLPLGGLYVKRYLSQKNGLNYFTHEVWFKGLTSGIFAKMFGTKFKEMLPEVMANIQEIAEKK